MSPSDAASSRQPAGQPRPSPAPRPLPPGLPPLMLILLYGAIGALPLLLVEEPVGGFWHTLSSGLAMVAFALLMVQFVLSSRLPALTGRVGIDMMMHFHQMAAKVITVALLLHPLLYVVPLAAESPARAAERLIALFTNEAFASGVAAWVMLLLLTVAAVLRDWLPIHYEAWRLTHGFGAAAIAAAGLHHAIEVGSHSGDLTLAQFWIVLLGLAYATLVHLYLVKPWQLAQRPYYVSHVLRLGERTWGITLWPAKLQPVGLLSRLATPKVTKAIAFEAGQFAWITVGASPFVLSDHPLSIASAPADGPRLKFVIKEVGDFSRAVGRFPVGTRAYVDGPHGVFTLAAAEAALSTGERVTGLAFVAGGVGIAPILSLLRDRRTAGEARPLRLLYGNRAASQIVCRDELDGMAQAMDFQVRHVLSEPPYAWSGGVGVLDGTAVDGWLDWPEPETWIYFVCGPTAMMNEAERALMARGVPPRRIIAERFRYD